MGLLADLSNMGVRRGYDRYVLQLEPILQEMGQRGMPVSPQRHAEITAELETRLVGAVGAMQALIPDEVKKWTPKDGYKRTPKDTTGLVERGFPVGTTIEGLLVEMRWVKLKEWKPSHDGLIRYMKHRGHSIPTDHKSGKSTTTEIELIRLGRKTNDFLYDAVLVYRQIGNILNNHLKNWKPGADGRVHPTFYYDTGTGQLAARRPNTANAPKHGLELKKELADKFRSMVVARPGHTLVELDYKSFHAQTLAFEANDADYLRLAKLDIHSYLTAHLMKLPDAKSCLAWDDEKLGAYLADVKEKHTFVRDYKAKRAILGYGFGMGWRKLYNMNRESFDSMNDAKQTMDMLNGAFPRAAAWRNTIRQKAHEQGYLMSRFGCVRWFWEVFKWQGGQWQNGGEDSEAAVAFLPANDAFCHIKESLLWLQKEGALQKANLINQIHDALMFECPDTFIHNFIGGCVQAMETPSTVLVSPICPKGLSVEVGVSIGTSWDKMRKFNLKTGGL